MLDPAAKSQQNQTGKNLSQRGFYLKLPTAATDKKKPSWQIAKIAGLALLSITVLSGCSNAKTASQANLETSSGEQTWCQDAELSYRYRMQQTRPAGCQEAKNTVESAKSDQAAQQTAPEQNEKATSVPTSTPTNPATTSQPSAAKSTQTATASPTTPTTNPNQVPAKSLSVGQTSPYGSGDYLLWIKAENATYIVKNGKIIHAFTSTDNDEKTPVGDYKVIGKVARTSSASEASWKINYFVSFYRRPGQTAYIGFHAIPDRNGKYYQDLNSIGQPGYKSDGCVRLLPDEAKILYDFAKENMPVKVR